MSKFSINKVILAGNVGHDAELRHYPNNGKATLTLRLATSKSYMDTTKKEWVEVTEWHTLRLHENLAERIAKQVEKGTALYVEGELRTRKWQDKDGKDVFSTEVHCFVAQVIARRKAGQPGTNDEPLPPDGEGGEQWKFGQGGDDIPY